jgi:hypothetical protein
LTIDEFIMLQMMRETNMAKTSSKSKSSWPSTTCELLAVAEVLPRLFIKSKRAKNGINEFRLVAGPRTGNRSSSYKITFKKGAMTKFWKDRVFESRGIRPWRVDESLGPKPSSRQINSAWRKLKDTMKSSPISTERLECDTKVPVLGAKAGGSRKNDLTFGSLRLYRVPSKAGARPLFIAAFAGDGSPDGSGGGSTVHN